MAKYSLHKITKKEAKKLLKTYGNVVDFTKDCYCLVNKKGNILQMDDTICIFQGTLGGRTKEECSFKRAIQAYSYFKDYAKQSDVSFKKLEMFDLLNGNFYNEKIKIPKNCNLLEVSMAADIPIGKDFVDYLEKINKAIDNINDLKKDIPKLDKDQYYTVSFDYEDEDHDYDENLDYEECDEDSGYDIKNEFSYDYRKENEIFEEEEPEEDLGYGYD